VDNAVAHGEDRDQVQSFIDTIFKIPATVPPTKLEVDQAAALQKVKDLQAAIDSMHGRSVDLGVNLPSWVFTGHLPSTLLGVVPQANGGTVPKAAGGMTVTGPGGPKADRVPMLLSPGEEVTQWPQAELFRPLLKAINRGDRSRIAELAGSSRAGSTVVHKTVTNQISVPAVETQEPRVYAQIVGREIGRRLALA